MRTQRHGRKGIGRELLVVIMVLALLAPGLAAKEKRGHDVIVAKKDGTAVSGELLAVRGTDLIIRDGSNSAGITASLADVKSVKVIKSSKLLKGVGMGFLIGAPIGALLGVSSGKTDPGWFEWTPGQGAVGFGVLFGVTGMLIGGTAGAIASIDKNVRIEAPTPVSLASAAGTLRRYARERN
jgi:hypothetical protein